MTLEPTLADESPFSDVPHRQLHVFARVYDEFQALPSKLVLGMGKVNDILEGTVTIRSRRGRQVALLHVRTSPSGSVQSELLERLPGNATAYSVSQRITKLGLNQSEVVFSVMSEDDNKSHDLILQVVSHGLAE